MCKVYVSSRQGPATSGSVEALAWKKILALAGKSSQSMKKMKRKNLKDCCPQD